MLHDDSNMWACYASHATQRMTIIEVMCNMFCLDFCSTVEYPSGGVGTADTIATYAMQGAAELEHSSDSMLQTVLTKTCQL